MRVDDLLLDFNRNLPEMPKHTRLVSEMPRSYSQGLPKNLMEYSAHLDNKFLNNNLAIIDEIEHRDPLNIVPKWFRDYQMGYFSNHGILAHDGFFSKIIESKHRGIFQYSMLSFSAPGLAQVNGAQLETYASGGSSVSQTLDQLRCYYSSGTVGIVETYYDEIAVNSYAATGNIHLGVYSETSSAPDDLLADTGSIALTADYAFKSLSAFALTTTNVWLCDLKSASSNLDRKETGTLYYLNMAYGALPNPFGTETGTAAAISQMKLAHT